MVEGEGKPVGTSGALYSLHAESFLWAKNDVSIYKIDKLWF
jgi:hypothetical protein